MEKFSIREVVEMALQTEKTGYRFYTEMAEKFKDNADLKSLYTRLATMELRHEAVFGKLLDTITTATDEALLEGWQDAQSYLRAIVESQFFLGRGKGLTSLPGADSAAAATDFAIKFEKETLLFFVGLRAALKDKSAVDKIIEEEASHIAWLSAFRETLKP